MIKHALALSLALGGLVVAAVPASAQVTGHIGINVGPPAPVREGVPPPPGPGYAWRRGHWRWNGARYVWVRGAYARPPFARARWIPGHWARARRGWFWVEGRWV